MIGVGLITVNDAAKVPGPVTAHEAPVTRPVGVDVTWQGLESVRLKPEPEILTKVPPTPEVGERIMEGVAGVRLTTPDVSP